MILDDIRELKKDIDELKMKIDAFTTAGAIRYDKECVQTSPSGDSLEKMIIRLIEDKDNLEHLIKEYQYYVFKSKFCFIYNQTAGIYQIVLFSSVFYETMLS